MKHLVYIHLLNDFSGSPKVLSQVITNFKEQGYSTELYTGKSSTGFLSGLVDKHHYYFYKRFNNKYFTLVTFFLSQFILFFKLLKYRNKEVVFYVNTMLPFGAGLAGKVLGKPVIYHIHETSLSPKVFKTFLRAIVQRTAHKIIFVSHVLQATESFHKKNEYVIYNALSKDFISKIVPDSYQPLDANGNFKVFMICSLKAYKGVDEFIEIANNCKQHPHIRFTLILNASGKDIEAYFLNQNLPDNLRWLPSQSQIHGFYKEASLVLNLSRVDECVETFGLTILEAMAYSIPVIVPPVGGPSEIVTNGKEGYLVSAYNTDDITTKIIELSTNQDKCLEFSKNAYERSLFFNEHHFNLKITAAVEA